MKKIVNSEGFTLIEVLVAMVILSVGLIGLMGVIGNSYGDLQLNQDRNKANALLEQRAEIIKQTTFSSISDSTYPDAGSGITVTCDVYANSPALKNVTLTAAKGSRQLGGLSFLVYDGGI